MLLGMIISCHLWMVFTMLAELPSVDDTSLKIARHIPHSCRRISEELRSSTDSANITGDWSTKYGTHTWTYLRTSPLFPTLNPYTWTNPHQKHPPRGDQSCREETTKTREACSRCLFKEAASGVCPTEIRLVIVESSIDFFPQPLTCFLFLKKPRRSLPRM